MTARPSPAEVGLTALLVVFMLFGTHGSAQGQEDTLRDIDVGGFVLAGAGAAALAARRIAPRATVLASGLAAAVFLGAGYPFGPVLFALALATLSAARRLPVAESLPACAAAVGILVTGMLARFAQEPGWGAGAAVLSTTGWAVVPWSIGAVLRMRSEGRIRTRREESERAVNDERLRIATEVHDVAGHGLAVIAMQAGVALHVLERRPEQARIALEEIRAASTEALDGLRATLDHLRVPDAEGPRTPGPPGLDAVDKLLERIRRAGLDITLTEIGVAVELPEGTSQAAYRIVQESLTNVLRHASASRATVALRWTAGFVIITVTDDGCGTADAEGAGIAGMRRRADELGGILAAGPLPHGGYEVRATLPNGRPGGRWRIEGGGPADAEITE